jgi:hypothetical protein
MYDLMQTHNYVPAMQRELMQDIQTAKPAFLVMVNVGASWLVSEHSDRTIMKWSLDYASKYYDMVGKAWILPDRTEYVWGREASSHTFDTSLSVSIWKRKPGV